MKKTITYLLTIILCCCTPKKDEGYEKSEIISFMIDKLAFPLIPPPPENDFSMEFNKKLIDSLNKTKLKIGLYPILSSSLKDFESLGIPKEYNYLTKKDLQKGLISVSNIKSKKGHQIILVDTLQLRKTVDFDDIDLLFHFSNIYFNETKDRALFELGISTSRLAGSSAVYGLKKENGQWVIGYVKEIEIW